MVVCPQFSGNTQGCWRQRTIGQKLASSSVPKGRKTLNIKGIVSTHL